MQNSVGNLNRRRNWPRLHLVLAIILCALAAFTWVRPLGLGRGGQTWRVHVDKGELGVTSARALSPPLASGSLPRDRGWPRLGLAWTHQLVIYGTDSGQSPFLAESTLHLPLAFLAGLYLLVALWFAVRRWRRDRVVGVCLHCGYDLRGSDSPRCPECGEIRTPAPAGGDAR